MIQSRHQSSSWVDAVERMFDDPLFKRKTFFELNQPGKTYLILNASAWCPWK